MTIFSWFMETLWLCRTTAIELPWSVPTCRCRNRYGIWLRYLFNDRDMTFVPWMFHVVQTIDNIHRKLTFFIFLLCHYRCGLQNRFSFAKNTYSSCISFFGDNFRFYFFVCFVLCHLIFPAKVKFQSFLLIASENFHHNSQLRFGSIPSDTEHNRHRHQIYNEIKSVQVSRSKVWFKVECEWNVMR